MTEDKSKGRALSEEELQELVAASDSGARNPAGNVGKMLAIVAAIWSLFQVVLASPLSNVVLPGDIINNSRQIHLAFAIFLAFMAYPALKSSPRHYIPIQDWFFSLFGTFTALYGYILYDKIVQNGGLADDMDKWFALAGLVLLFEAARRALGPAMA
ncbi:C4-dicarboxylate ABC transporter, partial [Escherichia coli]|nr:C4-dicarboxylate ABC transporter [Escherichia coli]